MTFEALNIDSGEGKTNFVYAFMKYRKGKVSMGVKKKVSRPKSPVTVRDPHFQEYDIQKERNVQNLNRPPKG